MVEQFIHVPSSWKYVRETLGKTKLQIAISGQPGAFCSLEAQYYQHMNE